MLSLFCVFKQCEVNIDDRQPELCGQGMCIDQ